MKMTCKPSYFLLTGSPGVGKTTITKKVCSVLKCNGVKTEGFYTEEVRNGSFREGFDVVSLTGEHGRLARDQSLLPGPVRNKVGKYGVLIEEFENVALSSSAQPTLSSVLVIDEIGKMEFFSNKFKSRIKEIFGPASNNIVLATIPLRKSDELIETIRNNKRSKVWTVTRENRNNLHEEIVAIITKYLDEP